MHKTVKLIAIMAALSTGSAMAAGTLANTAITNTATAAYSDVAGNPQPTVTSNTVTSTVQEVPSFIVKAAGQDSTGAPAPTGFTPASTLSAKPGDTVSFLYTLTNTGNVADNYVLSTQLTYSFKPDGTADAFPLNVKYYPASADTNSDGVLSQTEIAAATPITTLPTVAADDPNTAGNDGSVVNFFVTYTVPTTSLDLTKLGTDPVVSGAKATTPDNNNYNQTTVSRTDAGLLGPYKDANANGIVDGSGTPGTPVTPYATVEGRTVSYSADSQTTTVPSSAAAQTVSFNNTVLNTGNRPDVFNITVPNAAALDAAGFPTGTTATLFLVDAAGLNPVALSDTNGDGILDVGTLAPNAAAYIRVVVNLPAGARPDAPGTVPAFTVTATSSNTPSNADSTVDRVQLSGVDFGDATAALGTSPAPAVAVAGNPGTPVYLPMDVYNAGNVADTFTLAGSVPIPMLDGSTATVPVQYYVDTNADGVLSAAELAAGAVTSTGSIAPGAEAKLIGVINIPANAASSAGGISVTQTATSPASGAVASDTNDTVKVGTVGALDLKKFVDNCGKTNVCPTAPTFASTPANNTPVPGDVLRYTVIAKNNTNNVVRILSMKDTLPANTTFVSVLGNSTAAGAIYYRVNGGAYTTTVPTTLTTGQSIEIAVDSSGNGVIDAADTVPVGGSLTLDFRVKVN